MKHIKETNVLEQIEIQDEIFNWLEESLYTCPVEYKYFYRDLTMDDYWDGSNWKSILLDTEFGHIDCQYEIVDGDEAEEIINDYKDAEFIEEVRGITYYQGTLHKYSVSRWQGNPWSFEVE